MTYSDPTTPRGTLEFSTPDVLPRPVRPARPPAHCDRREFRAFTRADFTYRRDLAAFLAAGGRA